MHHNANPNVIIFVVKNAEGSQILCAIRNAYVQLAIWDLIETLAFQKNQNSVVADMFQDVNINNLVFSWFFVPFSWTFCVLLFFYNKKKSFKMTINFLAKNQLFRRFSLGYFLFSIHHNSIHKQMQVIWRERYWLHIVT